jgi:hypothetical protein
MLSALGRILRDPLYRYEARRYWTRWRYGALLWFLLGWWALVMAGLYYVSSRSPYPLDEPQSIAGAICWTSLLGRLPLSWMAATGAALAIAPERASGQLEQMVLTPVDPWRFCLARFLARLRGVFVYWCLVSLPFVILWTVHGVRAHDPWGRGTSWPALIYSVASVVDTAAMLVVAAAVGMRFTSTARSTAAALAKTYLAALVLVPIAMFFWALTGMGVGALISNWFFRGYLSDMTTMGMVFMPVFRMGLGAAAVLVSLRDARRAIGRTFYMPEEASAR